MKILALDIGDQWTGIAISDALGFFARPLKTVKTSDLIAELTQLLTQEKISKIVIGNPKTMRGQESDQTRKVHDMKNTLEAKIPQINWVLWDERLSSKRAQTLKPAKSKEEKLRSHSVAAAFILASYLDFTKQQQVDVDAN